VCNFANTPYEANAGSACYISKIINMVIQTVIYIYIYIYIYINAGEDYRRMTMIIITII